jgi:hypothetical protein
VSWFDYVMICFVDLHFTQGMYAPLTVTEPAAAEPEPVEAEATVGVEDFSFDVPEGFDGQGTFEVTNTGDQPHEWTIADSESNGVGGFTITAPGTTGYVDLDLPPGDYTFLCFVNDPETGQLHFQQGMSQPVTIS